MAKECNTHDSLSVEDVYDRGKEVAVSINCEDCDGYWDLSGSPNSMKSYIELATVSKLHPDFEELHGDEF
jgi:hypothetical protein